MVKRVPLDMTLSSLMPRSSLSTKVPVFEGASRMVYLRRLYRSRVTFRMQCVMSILGSTVSIGQLILLPFM